MKHKLFAAAGVLATLSFTAPAFADQTATMRLEWTICAQFAGELVALDKGYYKAGGVDMTLLPAGTDIKPAVTVSQGSDTFGVGHINQVIMARSHGAPLVMVAEYGQKSAEIYIARKDSGIEKLQDVRGKKVGSWFGGDEAEFLAMIHTVGMSGSDVQLIPEEDDPVPQLITGQLDVIEEVRYLPSDLQVLYNAIPKSKLTIFYPEAYNAALVNTGMFVTEKTIKQHPEMVQAVVDATTRGWQEAIADPEAAAKIVLKYDPELKLADEIGQIKEMANMFCAGPTLQGKFGESTPQEWTEVQNLLLSYGTTNPDGLHKPIDLNAAYTNSFWDKTPASSKMIACK